MPIACYRLARSSSESTRSNPAWTQRYTAHSGVRYAACTTSWRAINAGKNLFLSPFSIRVALAMCAVERKGETRRVLATIWSGAPFGVDEQNRQYGRLLKSINGEGERPFQLVTANALWGQQGYRFKPDYKKVIADFYDGTFHEVDFRAQPDEAVKTINAWVSDKTREKIKDLIKQDFIQCRHPHSPHQRRLLQGRLEGNVSQTQNQRRGLARPCRQNRQRADDAPHRSDPFYCEGDGFQALDLPYKGQQLSMLVVLPRKKDGLASLERRWAAGGGRQVTDGAGPRGRSPSGCPPTPGIPETEFKLKPVLGDLGADLAFNLSADFSGIGEERLMISEVVHKAFVEVNEEGTEAAAARLPWGMVMMHLQADDQHRRSSRPTTRSCFSSGTGRPTPCCSPGVYSIQDDACPGGSSPAASAPRGFLRARFHEEAGCFGSVQDHPARPPALDLVYIEARSKLSKPTSTAARRNRYGDRPIPP